jgi:cytochrome c oxidase subunit 4
MTEQPNSHMPEPGDPPRVGHEVPWTILAAVAVILLVLTAVTVKAGLWARTVELGSLGLWVAMAIATIKATLVCMYFMHLRYDRPFNRFAWVAGIAFVALLISFLLMDSVSYHDELYSPTDPAYAPDRVLATTGNADQ